MFPIDERDTFPAAIAEVTIRSVLLLRYKPLVEIAVSVMVPSEVICSGVFADPIDPPVRLSDPAEMVELLIAEIPPVVLNETKPLLEMLLKTVPLVLVN